MAITIHPVDMTDHAALTAFYSQFRGNLTIAIVPPGQTIPASTLGVSASDPNLIVALESAIRNLNGQLPAVLALISQLGGGGGLDPKILQQISDNSAGLAALNKDVLMLQTVDVTVNSTLGTLSNSVATLQLADASHAGRLQIVEGRSVTNASKVATLENKAAAVKAAL